MELANHGDRVTLPTTHRLASSCKHLPSGNVVNNQEHRLKRTPTTLRAPTTCNRRHFPTRVFFFFQKKRRNLASSRRLVTQRRNKQPSPVPDRLTNKERQAPQQFGVSFHQFTDEEGGNHSFQPWPTFDLLHQLYHFGIGYRRNVLREPGRPN